MQRNDANDVKQRRGSGPRDQSGQSPQQESVQHYVLTGQLQAITGTGRQTTLGLLPSASPGSSLGSSNVAAPVVGSSTPLQHQTVVVSSQDLERIFTGGAPGPSAVATTPGLSAQALQRQLSSQGIVGVISPGVSRTVTGPFSGGATTALIRQAGATPSGPELQIPPTLTLVTATTPSGAPGVGTLSASGATVHHHGLSPSRGTPPTPRANLQQPSQNMSIQPTGQQQTPKTIVAAGATAPTSATNLAMVGKVLQDTKPSITPLGLTHTFPNLTALANQSAMGPSPKKKVKVEEKAPATTEIANNRKLILDQKHREMIEIKENYIEYLTELFFLQNSGNMMDYHTWKKRPTPQLVHFLKSGNLDSDEEDDHGQERKINNEVKVITCSGSNVPLATPVAISTTLPPSVAALNQQAPSQRTAASTTTNSTTTLTTSTVATVSMPQLQSQMSKAADTKPPVIHTTHTTKATHTISTSNQPQSTIRLPKSPPTSPGGTPRLHTRQHTISNIYDGSIGSQEAIVERAKQEAQVMQRVAELRKEGLWSSRRLPKVQEPPRNKSHWDYLLEEMQWLAADFQQERKWKKAAARKVAKMVSKYFQDLEQKEIRAEKEEAQKLKRIAGQIAKQVREFWTNVEKVVQYKQQTRNEEKRKKALDLHLNFIVDQTEKYSTWLTEGLKKDRAGSSGGSGVTTPEHSIDGGDREFEPEADESDDEETIEKAEADMDETSTQAELDALQKEGEVPLEELLKSLPQEVLSGTASLTQDTEEEADEKHGKQDKDDDEFAASEEEEVDVEETIEEQETLDKKVDYSKELEDLQNEGDMDMDELYKKYAGAYDSDFEMPESESGTEDDSDDDEDEDDSEEEEEESSEGEEEEGTEENTDNKEEEVGLDFLMTSDSTSQDTQAQGDTEEKGPGKELVDIAAEAQSLQPKGYTLQTTEVKTKVPFLIKHTLREYQHVGLDWLATMYEKRLNGILADEMGLGKTIQTIALLAHLACDKGIWGPHLIVVPTSVMLNWEMEIKKWCPAFKILTYYGTQKERKLKRQGWTKTNAFHVCITSYKLVIQDHQSFRRKKWKYFILDEAQNIKNFKSQRWQTLLNFSSQRRLLLTGTPLQNNLMELWSLMHFLMPNVFQSHREFKEWFANPLTGMIEGSHEYNESLIKRLHKVLRPFLLRRLKADVEKQMPKKYEHVVMCQLSKRQRFLYDDFMSQGKTKETLASGHFMSVINILMQLRKVCNHPSLFDERPIVSPFQTQGIIFHTCSAVLHMLDYDPFKDVDLLRYPGLADMEQDLPAFVAHRVKRLQTSRQLIEEIDDQPDPPPRIKPGKLKPVNFRSISPLSRSVSPLTNQTPATSGTEKTKTATSVTTSSATTTAAVGTTITSTTPTTLTAAVTPRTQSSVTMTTSSVTQPLSAVATSVAAPSASVTSTLSVINTSSGVITPQAKVGPITTATVSLPSSSGQVATSQPITVQIQQTDQGARLMIPAGQLSQLPAGFIQIVQTSMGQQIIASSVGTTAQQRVGSPSITATSSVGRATTTSSTIVNGLPAITTIAASTASTTLTTVTSQVKPAMSVQLPSASTAATLKPVMKVSPMVTATTSTTNVVKAGVSTTVSSAEVKSTTGSTTRSAVKKTKQRIKTELMLDSVCDKRECRRQEKLEYIARINKLHCERKPVYGQDLRCTVNVMSDTTKTCVRDNTWPSLGHVHCTNVNSWNNPYRPEIFWKQTKVLSNLVHTPLQYLHELEDILSRYVFATPPVVSPCIKMHVSHPPPSTLMSERCRDFILHKEVSPKASCLHKISTNRMVQFPELRLIQYDCGKLQTLDLLLRRLKSGDHRVLIFTQMTKMLNILESFLSYHGHRYLRLDGTTRVEQRQFLMDRFNADRRIFCFILSTRSGGIGVNLTGADTVIFYDSDWNPTMDAQAQDRCHRIGQTRDVHIYRLISKKTVEENILKKANQKRMLGDMAIEGGNFTTAFFKENTIQELFSEPSGLDSLVEQPKVTEIKTTKPLGGEIKDTKSLGGGDEKQAATSSDKSIVAQFEQALGKAEDETDVVAANLVKAEQKAELAEFDENIPWDEREAEKRKEEEEMSKAEQELAMLDKELSPIERFAVTFMENEMKPDEDLEISVEEIANSKKDWELARLKALKEDEERRLELEEDEMLYTYLRDDSYNQVKKRSNKQSKKARGNLTSPARQSAGRRPGARGRGKGVRGQHVPENVVVGEEGDPVEGDIVVDDESSSEPLIDRLKAARSAMRNLAAKLTVPASPKKKSPVKNITTAEDKEKPSPKQVPAPKKVTARQAKAALQKQLKGTKVPLKVPTLTPPKVTNPSIPTSVTPPKADKKSAGLTVQRLVAKQALQQHLSNVSLGNVVSQGNSEYTSPPSKLPGLNTQPQLLTPSQLQHLKQIISKAHHNIKQTPVSVKGSVSQGVQGSPDQPTFTSIPQQAMLQVTQPRPYQIVAPQGQVPQTIRHVLPQGVNAQPIQHVVKQMQALPRGQLLSQGQGQPQLQLVSQTPGIPGSQAIHLVTQNPQLGGQGVQLVTQGTQGLPVVSQTQQILTQTPGVQQVIGAQGGGAQPTISFIKVSGNTTVAQQPVLQYCVNPVGGQGVRLQTANPQFQGANPQQQGLVFLQLAGGKAIPMSVGGSPVAMPMARMIGNKIIPSNTIPSQRLRQVVPTTATGQAQQISFVQNQNPTITTTVTTPRLSMPMSRFQSPNHVARATKTISKVPSVPMALAGPTDQVLNRAPPVALLGAKRLPNTNTTTSLSVPQPWSNPNLVIRTRRAVMQDNTPSDKVDAEVGVPNDAAPATVNAVPAPASQTFTVGTNPQNPQFISLIKAGSNPVIPVGANVTIKNDALPSTVETVFQPFNIAIPSVVEGTSNGTLLYNDNG